MDGFLMGTMVAAAAICTLASTAPHEHPEHLACEVSGKATGELTAAEICAVFAPLLPDGSGRSIAVTMPTAWRAKVVLRAADGSEIASRGVSVSDRALYRGLWEEIARELAAELSTRR